MRKFLLSLTFLLGGLSAFSQSTTTPTISLQACQGDSLVLAFDITSPFNVGNTFSVEMSDGTGNFNGTFVSISPLLAYGVSTGNEIDVLIPENTSQGVYSFRMVSSNPVVISDTISNVIIGANPTTGITAYNWFDKAGEITFCDGDTALLVANQAPTGQSYTYYWLSGGGAIAGETNDTLFVTASGTYAIEVSSNLCDATSNDTIVNSYSPIAAVFANSGAGINYIGMDSIRMCEGTVATLEYFAFPSPGITGYEFNWLKADSVDIFGDTVWYYTGDTTASVDVDATSQWYLEVTSVPGGCVDTSNAFWVIVDTIPATIVINQPWPGQALPTTTLCLTDSTLLTATDTVLYDSWEYQWQIAYPSGSGNWLNLSNDTLPWLTVDTSIVADTADYRLVLTNESCDYISNETTVNIVPFPTISILPGDSLGVCVYDSVLVSLQSNALNFAWNGGLFVGKQNFLSVPGQYVIEAFGVNQCKTVDTLDIYNYTLVANASATVSSQYYNPPNFITGIANGGSSYFWYANKPIFMDNVFNDTVQIGLLSDSTSIFVDIHYGLNCLFTDSLFLRDTSHILCDVYDTNFIDVFDTIAVFDSNFVDVFDTVAVFDTIYITQIDSVVLTVTDTLIIDVSLIGINPLTFEYQVLVYPNPTNNFLNVDIPQNMIGQQYSLEIVNAIGQSMYGNFLNQQQLQINLNSFASTGTYILQIKDSGGTIVSTKIIILQ